MTVTLPVAMTMILRIPLGQRVLEARFNLFLVALMFIYVYACQSP